MGVLIENYVTRKGVALSQTPEPRVSTAPQCPKPSPDHVRATASCLPSAD